MNFIKTLTLVSILFLSFSCKKDDNDDVETNELGTGTMSFMVQNSMKNLDGDATNLVLDQAIFKTADGDTLNVSSLKYFISNVVLTNEEGEDVAIADSYHLVESSATEAMSTFNLSVPEGNYTKITFSLGVDETANGDETIIKGDLDPNSDMTWNWNIGYKFILFEGAYNANTTYTTDDGTTSAHHKTSTVGGNFMYHIGVDENYTTFTEDLPKTLSIQNDQTSEVMLMANFDNFFSGVNTIDVETLSTAMVGPADDVAKLVANYAKGLFMVHHVKNPE